MCPLSASVNCSVTVNCSVQSRHNLSLLAGFVAIGRESVFFCTIDHIDYKLGNLVFRSSKHPLTGSALPVGIGHVCALRLLFFIHFLAGKKTHLSFKFRDSGVKLFRLS